MARMITGMFPQPSQTDPASQSESENSVTSDIGDNVLFIIIIIILLQFQISQCDFLILNFIS